MGVWTIICTDKRHNERNDGRRGWSAQQGKVEFPEIPQLPVDDLSPENAKKVRDALSGYECEACSESKKPFYILPEVTKSRNNLDITIKNIYGEFIPGEISKVNITVLEPGQAPQVIEGVTVNQGRLNRPYGRMLAVGTRVTVDDGQRTILDMVL